jgi:hypothetical protein
LPGKQVYAMYVKKNWGIVTFQCSKILNFFIITGCPWNVCDLYIISPPPLFSISAYTQLLLLFSLRSSLPPFPLSSFFLPSHSSPFTAGYANIQYNSIYATPKIITNIVASSGNQGVYVIYFCFLPVSGLFSNFNVVLL